MLTALLLGGFVLALAIALALWQRTLAFQRERYIRTFELPRGLFESLRKRRPQLTLKECQLVAHALRQFFLAHLKSGRRFVSMPSQVADDLWHEFILYTREYKTFCRKAFGGFLHHTPAVVLSSNRKNNEGLRRVWWHCCKEENIDPVHPSRLPLLFALDAKYKIAGGFTYHPQCEQLRQGGSGAAHCGGDFASSSVDGSTDGFGDSSSDGSGGDSGGGDGGGGDGGGGCGGGD